MIAVVVGWWIMKRTFLNPFRVGGGAGKGFVLFADLSRHYYCQTIRNKGRYILSLLRGGKRRKWGDYMRQEPPFGARVYGSNWRSMIKYQEDHDEKSE
jgi:hypothetical protein